jgi:hypothetical protein
MFTKAERDKMTVNEIINLMKEGKHVFSQRRAFHARPSRGAESYSRRAAPRCSHSRLHRLACASRGHHGPGHWLHFQRASGGQCLE